MTRPITAADLGCLGRRIETLRIYLDETEWMTARPYFTDREDHLTRLEAGLHDRAAADLAAIDRCLPHAVMVSLEQAVERAADCLRAAWQPGVANLGNVPTPEEMEGNAETKQERRDAQ